MRFLLWRIDSAGKWNRDTLGAAMMLFAFASLVALLGAAFYLAQEMGSDASLLENLRALPPLDQASIGFFLTTLVLFAIDEVYWVRYWETPNYLVVWAAIGALVGLVYRNWAGQYDARADGEGSVDRASERWSIFAVFTAFLAFYGVTGVTDHTPYNAHVMQAMAFLRGHADIEYSGAIEMVTVAGRHYQLHPPLPAIMLMPFVAIWGLGTNQTAFSLVGGAIDAALAWWMLGQMKLSVSARVWLTMFFSAGTVMWFNTLNGGSWDVSQIVAVGLTLGALGELFGAARPGIIGLLAGLSALSRNDLALDFPIFMGLWYVRRHNWRELLWMAPGFALAGVIYVGMNEARFSSIFDLGQFLYTPGTPTFARGYLPQNVYTLLFMPPKLEARFPWVHPISSGQALTFTSPAFVLALRANLASLTPLLLFLGAVLAMMPSLFFNNNGGAQFGTRHYIHSFPFLLALMAKGLPGYVDQFTRILILVSIFLIAAGVYEIRVWGLA